MPRRQRFLRPLLALALLSGLASAAAARLPSSGYQQIRLPNRPGSGPPMEEAVLFETDDTKLVTVTLRRGTELPERSYGSPVTMQALHGNGTVNFEGGATSAVGPGRMLAIASGKRHSVKPGVYGYLVLLVQQTKTARSHTP